ncbi:MAG: hypothetical protein F6J87_08430 [Spirulina sp. SIO3F2]|nr:hypothetical protein [Spirulina sp. SIO3F2]
MQTLPTRRDRQITPHPLRLDRAIRVIKERVSPQQTLCHGISFHLDSASLSRVHLAQARQQKLHITRNFLNSFRQYVLFDPQGHLQTGVTFLTFYQFGEHERPLLKTFLSLDGDIIHKIAEECLQDERLAQDLTAAHYWLIQQLFRRLQLEVQQFLDRLSWGSTAVMVGGYWLSQWQQFLQADPRQKLIELALTVGVSWLLKLLVQQGLRWIAPWLQRQLVRRLFPR